MVAATALVLTPTLSMAQQLPSGGSVAAGSATISSPNAATLNINQSSDRAIINWNSFSVGQGGTVNFNQPGASSATLNRVTGATPSSIAGSINAPGTVLLVNPNGIAITPTGTVNVGSFAASTLNIKDSDFMSGNYTFSGNGASAAVTNAGRINVSDGGFAALLGGQVANDGLISARLGKVGLGSGELITLDLAGDGFLSVAVPTSSLGGIVGSDGRPLVSNKGKIIADGGTVHLSAATAAGLLRDAVNVPGTIRANSVGTRNGKIIIGGGAGGKVQISGKVTASGGRTARGGSIDVSGAKVAVSGKVKANGTTGGRIKITGTESSKVSGEVAAKGQTGSGGVVVITAKDVTIESSGKVDVSGTSGGTLLIGGDYQGGANLANNFSTDPVANAETTTVAAGATLSAAGTSGQGGRVVVWSDDSTTFAGALDVSGQGGAGGFAEVSGHRLLDFTGTANLAGTTGAGTLLLDPRNVTISNATSSGGSLSGGTYTPSADDSVLNVATLQAALASGNVVVTTGLSGSAGSQDGNITVASAIAWSGSNTLTLTAANNIAINADITATSGGLIINATNNVSATGGINVGSFTMQRGAWTQIAATLPTFSATSFAITSGASFLRAKSGDGSSATPYAITDIYGLQGIGSSATLLGKSYVLASDIDASGTATWNSGAGFVPIGTTATQFSGTFDGQGHVITGLTIYRPSSSYVGLFGDTLNATITNVGLVGGSVTGSGYVGSLVGRLWSGTTASLSRSWADGVVVTGAYSGGLIGMVQALTGASATVSEAYASGKVTVTSSSASGGGLIGYVSSTGTGTATITKTYAIGNVAGSGSTVGGLVGSLSGSGATVSQSWASGALTGGYKGGIVGLNYGGSVTTSYWDKTTTGVTSGAGLNASGTVSASGLTSAQARTQSSYAGWDFTSAWTMPGGSTRPLLQMEASTTIYTAHQLQLVGMNATTLAASYTLARDIDFGTAFANAADVWGSAGFVPIGTAGNSFTGSADGNGHVVDGLVVSRASQPYTGLFGYVTGGGSLANVGVTNATVTGGNYTGILVGWIEGAVTNAWSSGSVTGINSYGASNVGGLIGTTFATVSGSHSTANVNSSFAAGGLVGTGQTGSIIIDSWASGAVSGEGTLGGLVGQTLGAITRSYASGAVTASTYWAGGLVGYAEDTTVIQSSYALGAVTAAGGYSGGLVGATGGTIANSYATGAVTGGTSLGGFVGVLSAGGTVSGSYWDTTTTGLSSGVGTNNGTFAATGITSTAARKQSTYAGWDFTNTWFMIDGETRPFLRSEYSTTITNAHQLQLMAMNTTVGTSYTLANDIVLGTALANPSEMWGTAGFKPIGSTSAQFKGSLDGGGHVIDGLTINRSTQTNAGLFGYVGSDQSVIQNLGLTNANVVGNENVGILAGWAYGTIDNVWTAGTVTGANAIGGLVGYVNANVSESHSGATVTGSTGVGGLIGRLASTSYTVSGSYATGAVTGASNVGGLIGELAGHLDTSFSTGAVSGSDSVGGLVGYASGGSSGATITNAYSTSAVTGILSSTGGLVGRFAGSSISNTYAAGMVSSSAGGLIGRKTSGTVTNSYWDTQTSGLSTSDGGTGVTTATLQAALPSGWNTATWGIIAGVSYPFLKSFWSGTPQVVSGTAYTNNGVTPASGGNVAVMVNGAAVGSASAGANGYYNVLLAPGTIGSNSQLVSFTSGTNAGVSYVQNAAGSITGLNILGNTLVEQSAASTLSSISSGLAVAIGSSGVSTALANRWIVATGSSFTIDQAISQTGNLVLSSNGTVTQTAGASISAATLKLQYISSGISYSLTDSGNAVSSLQPGNLGSGSLDFYSSTDLSVGAFTANGGLLIRTAGALTLAGPLSSSATGNAVVLSAGTGFVNNAGSSAISVPNGRWLVYAAAPTGSTFNNLDSGNTAVWNSTYAANAPATIASGNRYVFAYQPTLTFTSTDATKTYGTTVDLSGNYTVSGYQHGVAGAYLADTAATAYSGTPTVTSTGAVATASVSGGPYVVDVSQGTVTGLNGYAVSFVAAGQLTVNKASLTVTANNDAKTYDGLAYAGGNGVSYAGFVNNEDASVLGGTLAYGGTAQNAVNAGSYTLTASGLTAANYNITYASGLLKVNKADLTVRANDADKTYDGLAFTGGNGVSYVGFVNNENASVLGGTLAYGGTAQGAINAGGYTLTASGLSSANYNISYVGGALTVNKAALTVTANDAGKTYDGLAFSGGNGVSYVGFVNNENASVLGGTLAYGGTAQGAVNAGGYTLTASGLSSANYNISYVGGSLTVNKAALTVTANDAGKTYDGLAFSGGNGASYVGFVNNENASVLGGTLAYGGTSQGAINAGGYTLTASGLSSANYNISYVAGALTVNKAALTVTANDAGKTYDGLAFSGGNGVSYAGFVNNENASVLGGTLAYGGTAQGAINAGGYTLTASGLSSANYSISYVGGALTVNKAALTVTANDAGKTYDGLAFSGGNGVSYAGFVNNENASMLGGTLTYGGTAQGAVNAGGYTLTASGLSSANYNISYVGGSLTVNKAALTVTANDAGKTYDGLAFSGGNGVSYVGFVNNENASVLGGTLAYGGTAQGAVNAGGYTLTASGLSSANYNISYVGGSLTVNKAALTVTANDAGKTYDGLAFSGGNGVSYAGFVNNENASVLGGTLAYGGTSQGAINAGGYTLTASGLSSANYNISYVAGALTVNKAALTVTANDAGKTYDGLAFSGGNGVSYAGFVNNENASVLGGTLAYGGTSQGAINAGGYTLTASGLSSANYNISYVAGALTVNKAALTVTANDAGKTYDGLAFSGGNGVSYAGFVNNENASVLGGTLAYGGTAQGAINAGGYTLTASGLSSANYNISYVAGALTVNKAALTVTANDAGKTYDGLAFSGGNGVSYVGFVNNENASVLGGALAYGGTSQGAINAGSYTLTASGLSSANYNISYVGGALTVDRAMISAVAVANDKVYDGTTTATGSIVGFNGVVQGDAVNVGGSGTFAFADANVGTGKTVAVTGLTLSGASAGNYILSTTASSSASITPATLTIASAGSVAGSKVYNGTTSASVTGNGTLAGVIGGDVVNLLLAGTTYADKNVGTGKTVTGSYSLTGAEAGNYVLASTGFTGAADITPATLTVASNGSVAASKVYDGSTSATVTGNGTLSGVFGSDAVALLLSGTAYADKNVGAGKIVTGSYSLTGAEAGNYVLATTGFTGAADITPATLTLASNGSVAAGKVYDGTTAAAVTGNGTLSGVIGSDEVALLLAGTAYADKNVGIGKVVTGSYSLTGAGAGNYVLASTGFTGAADITPRAITVAAEPGSKTSGTSDPVFGFSLINGSLVAGDSLTGALSRDPGESVGSYPILQGTLAASQNYLLSYVGADFTILAAPTTPTVTATNSGDYPTSQYIASGSASTPVAVTISYQQPAAPVPVIAAIRAAAPVVRTAGTTGDVNQNIAVGSGAGTLFKPISQFDNQQYSKAELPGFAPEAAEATVLTMIARGETNNQQAFKIDALWGDGTASWSRLDHPDVRAVSFTDGKGAERVPGGGNAFAFVADQTDVAALLRKGPVVLQGGKIEGVATPWLLVLGLTADGKGLIANDPMTGQQVILAFDSATKSVGGVTAVINPADNKPVAVGDAVPSFVTHADKITPAMWSALKAFKPAGYFAVTM
ncbi:MBG domain-containing protein [Rhodopseudomonas palustris]|uniref:MBG domain-containing protein n=1 Tax=Rhodopseudomonas palustris TaxID=1076 RepID=UPI0021F3AD79|nr:MBG domain-containing protein [Rhodopseudomonas palustris]UYO55138.1 filamentous hemagglutinin N-terminal domain-containing protein [Rhodopseudomonas palustris]